MQSHRVRDEDIEVIESGNYSSRGGASQALAQLIQNPETLKTLFQLSPQQAENVRALLAGSGSALAVKLFSKHIGAELAAGIGGFLAAYASKKMLGGQ